RPGCSPARRPTTTAIRRIRSRDSGSLVRRSRRSTRVSSSPRADASSTTEVSVDLTFFAQVIVSGLATGAVYALVGMGYTVVFSSTRIFNLAQGQALMLGIMFTWQLRQDWGWPTPIAIVTAAVAAAAVNVLVERVAVAPLRPNRNFNVLLATLVTTIGASTVIGGLAVVVWGVNAKPFSPYFGARGLDVGGVTITAQQVLM